MEEKELNVQVPSSEQEFSGADFKAYSLTSEVGISLFQVVLGCLHFLLVSTFGVLCNFS